MSLPISRPISEDGGTDSSSGEGNRAVFVYKSASAGTWTLSNTLTRDTSLATYYSGIGKWIYTLDSSVNTVNKWDSKLHMKDGLVLHGIDGAPDSNFRDLDNTGLYNYGFGEFRAWRDVVNITTTTTSLAPMFKYGSKGAFNIRNQTAGKPYSVTMS